jgi:exopolysaccharide production protein ExoQ
MLLQGIAVVAPLASIYAPLFMAPLILMAALGVIVTAILGRRRIPLLGQPLLILLVLLVLWGAVSAGWSIYPIGSITTALQLLALFASGAVVMGGVALLDGTEAARIGRALVIGIMAALVIYTIEMALNSPIQSLIRHSGVGLEQIYSPFNRGLAVLVVLLPPALMILRRAGYIPLAVGLFGAAVVIVYVYYGSSVAVALACGIVAAALSFIGRGPMTRLIGWGVAAMVMAAPFIAREVITPATFESVGRAVYNVSVPHRLAIWQFVADKALERPFKGWGLDAARSFPGGNTTVPITTRACQPPCSLEVQRLPLHPHNMAMQWWLELGLPGAALGAAALFWLFRQIPKVAADRSEEALLVGQLTAAAAIAGLSYGAWQSWWLATLMLAMAFSAVALRATPVMAPMASSTVAN